MEWDKSGGGASEVSRAWTVWGHSPGMVGLGVVCRPLEGSECGVVGVEGEAKASKGKVLNVYRLKMEMDRKKESASWQTRHHPSIHLQRSLAR